MVVVVDNEDAVSDEPLPQSPGRYVAMNVIYSHHHHFDYQLQDSIPSSRHPGFSH